MKKVFIAFIFLFSGIVTIAQDITGNWQGLIPAGGKNLRLIFHVIKSGETYSAKFDSPDQNAFGLEVNKTRIDNDSIIAEITIIHGGYNGKWDGHDDIKGIFKQGPASFDLNLKRLSDAEKTKPTVAIIKSQTPKPPFSYSSENIVYDNIDHSVHYAATLTRPAGDGKFPAVVIISGSGSQDRDGTLGAHKSYAVLADYLTRKGIAVLRVDDRGVGGTSLGNDIDNITSEVFSKDVETGMAYLQSRSDIDTKKIGLIGHSEGGMIAPMIASRREDVAFIILLAGPGISGEKIWDYQMERNYIKPGLNEKDYQKAARLVHNVFSAFIKSTDYTTVKLDMAHAYQNWRKEVPDTMEIRLLTVKGEEAFIKWAEVMKAAHALHWINYFLSYQPAGNLQKVKCPLLALNGESDIQVRYKENLSGIEAALKKGNNKHYQLTALPGLNHMFQTCKTPLDNYETLEETFSPKALQLISDWIHTTVK